MEAHNGQRDRDGNAVILHPLIVGSMGKTDAEKCVGFLHDVIEDTDWTFEDLRNDDIPEEIIDALKLCTHDDSLPYEEYVQRIIDSGNMTALNVKLNDLHHNIARGKAYNYPKLVEKHTKALEMIEKSGKLQNNFSSAESPHTSLLPLHRNQKDIEYEKDKQKDEQFSYSMFSICNFKV